MNSLDRSYAARALSHKISSSKTPKIIAVGGGKGGVGKSLVASHLSVALSRMGFKVALIDLDFGAANIHSYFGISSPQGRVYALFFGNLNLDALTPTQDGIYLVHGGHEFWAQTQSRSIDKLSFFRKLRTSSFDFIVLDLGAGSRTEHLDFFLGADFTILVTTSEPTSVEKNMIFLRALAYRSMQLYARATKNSEIIAWMNKVLKDKAFISHPSFWLQRYSEQGYVVARQLLMQLKKISVGILVNQARHSQDMSVGTWFMVRARDDFSFNTRNLGCIFYENAVEYAVRKRQHMFTTERQDSLFVSSILQLAKQLLILHSNSIEENVFAYATKIARLEPDKGFMENCACS